jgi:tetratricopeptide (TPR) repeat protein
LIEASYCVIESVRPNDPSRNTAPSLSHDDDPFERAAADFTRRVRAGERPTVEEYADRFPEIADLLRELLPTIAAMERAKADTKENGRVAASLAKPPERLGDFRIVREIGRGGMGIVYEAIQQSLGRNVALKVLPPHVTADERRVRRFDEEARHAAGLHHTNIVPVFGVGADDGLHYYVMQLIDGEGLDRLVARRDDRRMTPTETAKIGRDVARALQCAHSHGILHRDVKPANILVDREGEVRITDFGLAQALEADGNSTQAHLAGTLNYMPPERFHGISEPRGDVYSLGVTLYELACGRTPFAAKSSVELMRRITSEATPPMRSAGADVPRDLETIIAKATAREPEGRYATAGELADDLNRFLEGTPIRARRTSALERAWRWSRRNRVAAAALITAVVSLTSLTIVSAVGYYRTSALNDNLAKALDGERTARTAAQTTSTTALEALDRVFSRFAPSSSLAVSFGGITGDGTDGAGDGTGNGGVMSPVPAVSPQIATALEELIPYYERLAAARGNDAGVERQAASALHRIGLIHARLGRFAEACDVWTRADEISRRLVEAEKTAGVEAGESALMATEIACDLGDVRRLEDRRTEARADYLRAIAMVDAIEGVKRADAGAASPETFEIRRQRARAHLALGSRDGRGRAPPAEGPDDGHPRGGPPGGGPPGGRPPGGGPPGGPHRPGFPPPPRRPADDGLRSRPNDDGFGGGAAGGNTLDGSGLGAREPAGDEIGGEAEIPASHYAANEPPADDVQFGQLPPDFDFGGPPGGGPPGGRRPPPFGPPGGRRPPHDGPIHGGPIHDGPIHDGPPHDDEPDRHEHLVKAHEQLTKLSLERPEDPVTRLLSARCFRQRAKENPPGKSEWESPDFLKATALLRGLRDEYPAVPDFAYELTEALADFHVEGLTPSDDDMAVRQLAEAETIAEKLVAEHPQTPAYLVSYVHLNNRRAAIDGRRGRKIDEQQSMQRAFNAQRKVAAQFPDSPQQAEWFGRIAMKYAEALMRSDRRVEAIAALEGAVEVVGPMADASTAAPPVQNLAGDLKRRLAELRPADKTE